MKALRTIGILTVGVMLGTALTYSFLGADPAQDKAAPLYWVAPMDPNYRRDAPGKSPMGMDLVPVYAQNDTPTPSDTVRIDPQVRLNMGIRTVKATKQVLTTSLRTAGSVTFNGSLQHAFYPRLAGWIDTVAITDNGERVVAGDTLFSVYSPELITAQEEWLRALQHNDTRLVKAARERLLSLGVAPSVLATIAKEGQPLHAVPILAPISGVIDHLAVQRGTYVSPTQQVLTITPTDSWWVNADVRGALKESELRDAHIVVYAPNHPGAKEGGVIDHLYTTVNALNGGYAIRGTVSNQHDRLKPGMIVEIDIHPRQRETSIVVPTDAVIRTIEGDRVVLRTPTGDFRVVPVEVDQYGQSKVSLLRGLKEGDEIVVSGQFLLDSEANRGSALARLTPAENPAGASHSPSDADHSTMHHESMHHESMHHESMHHESKQHESVHHDTMQHSVSQHGPADHNTAHDSEHHHATPKPTESARQESHSDTKHSSLEQNSNLLGAESTGDTSTRKAVTTEAVVPRAPTKKSGDAPSHTEHQGHHQHHSTDPHSPPRRSEVAPGADSAALPQGGDRS
jgi:Cu(I)/Ag(I) efflux system membrane fusion protein